jgi:hypothetical protein
LIRIRITDAAFDAIASSLASPHRLHEPQACAQGGFFIWLPRITVNQLDAMRGPREDLSAVIIRLAQWESEAA